MDVQLTVCGPDDLSVLLPLVMQYHEFEGIEMPDEARVRALTPLLVDNTLGCMLLIHMDGDVVGYRALCLGYSIEFGSRDAFIDGQNLTGNIRLIVPTGRQVMRLPTS